MSLANPNQKACVLRLALPSADCLRMQPLTKRPGPRLSPCAASRPRRTEGDGFNPMSDDGDDGAAVGEADGDGSVTDPGSAAGATPSPRQKGKGKAGRAPVESSGAEGGEGKDGSATEETASEGEATLGSPLKGKGKAPASTRGPSCASFAPSPLARRPQSS